MADYTVYPFEGTGDATPIGIAGVSTNGNGQMSITLSNGDEYLVNLNHTHVGMAKIVKFVEGEEPDPMRDDTIYVQVDDLQDPGEIQKLYLFGTAFEGGGGVIDETPRLTSPRANAEIDFNGQSSTTLRVKGLYLSSQLTVTSSGSITVTANGNAVSTISATDANNGIELTIAKGENFTNANCSLTFSSSEVSRTVGVKDSTMLPGGLFANKAWATRASVQTPVELSGYCITKFRVPMQASGRMKVSVKAGFTIQSSGLDFIGCALNKGADNNTNFTSTDAWGQSADPRLFTPAAGDGTAISATFKTSEIANCYIYDHNAGQYLWAGENVDTSVAPPIPS